MDKNNFDVVVVGAGPIGSATTRHLAEQGVDVAVIGPAEPTTFADHQARGPGTTTRGAWPTFSRCH